MASINSHYFFPLLSSLGFLAQWGVMVANGTFLGLVLTSWEGRFPSGNPMHTTWCRLWPIDYVLGLLVAFFYPLLNVIDLENPAPLLLLTDLLLSLAVFSFMATVEGRRNMKMGSLRYSALWQLAWQFLGAATVLPIYLHSYVHTRASGEISIPTDQVRVLPFVAIWSVLNNLFLLVPGLLGASPFVIQLSIVVWFFLPLTLEFIRDCICTVCTRYLPTTSRANKPILIGYGIVGSASAMVHIIVGVWSFKSSDMSWARMYWPAYDSVQPGPNLLLRGATLFCQYGYMSLCISVISLAAYTVSRGVFAAGSSSNRGRDSRIMVSLIATIAVFGPGAGAAWLLYILEIKMGNTEVLSKKL